MIWNYPAAKKEAVVDNFHGTRIADPYRWMENPDDPELQAWIDAQNTLTRTTLDGARRTDIHTRLSKLVNFSRYSAGFRAGSHLYFDLNDGLQNQPVMYQQNDGETSARVVFDPNPLSVDGTVALVTRALTRDGNLMAYGLSASGSDRQVIRIRHLGTGEDFPEQLDHARFASIAWKADNSGFFYDRFPAAGSGADPYLNSRVWWHTLGTPQDEDQLVFEQPDTPELSFSPILTHDGRYLVLFVWHGAIQLNRLYYRPTESDAPFVRLLNDADAKYEFVGNTGSTFYIFTNKDAPHGRLIAIDLDTPTIWRDVIPEKADTLSSVRLVGGKFIGVYLHDASHQLWVFEHSGAIQAAIPFPEMGTITVLTGEPDETEVFFGFTSLLRPTTFYRYNLTTETLLVFKQADLSIAIDDYETQQIFCTSKDGTRIPIFLAHRKGLALDGNHQTLMYGYGGYSVNLTPTFNPFDLGWLAEGGIYAQVVLRGGEEYGESWHSAGMLGSKQNVFDDFCAAGQCLVANGYTTPGRLAIHGASNGGLLVAACMLQHPELFGVVICSVPVTDMLRFHKFTAGRYWTPEYGDPDNPKHFPFMLAYSPLHNVRAGLVYSPIMILTADHDDRVVPMHSLKFAATLQEQAEGLNPNPVLLRVEVKAGHGLGKPISKLLDEYADIFAFIKQMTDTDGVATP